MNQKLTLYPDIFLWRKTSDGLLYNADNGNQYRFHVSNSVEELCRQFENTDNLYSVCVDTDAMDDSAREFVDAVTSRGFGKLTSTDAPIVSLPPLLNIQRSVERLKKDADRGIGENALEYLSTLTIYLGGKCTRKPYYKQIIYPVCTQEKLTADDITEFLKRILHPGLRTINLVVSDAADPELAKMGEVLTAYKEQVVFYFLHSAFTDKSIISLMFANAGYNVRLICEMPGNMLANRSLKNEILKELNMGVDFGYDFLVRDEREYQFWSTIVDETGMVNYAMIPVFDNNAEFFHKNVFLGEDDLRESRLSRREVFAHQAINNEAFGKLTVMPDGRVYSNVTEPALGTIHDSVYELITRELEQNYAWRRVRCSNTCSNCLYQWLCPSPSAYERAAGKKTICNFK